MKLPRDLSSEVLAKALEKLGYTVDRQTGSIFD
jgi:predicted RNA binding protein YcfA (HicA-like mRNA interferase family)